MLICRRIYCISPGWSGGQTSQGNVELLYFLPARVLCRAGQCGLLVQPQVRRLQGRVCPTRGLPHNHWHQVGHQQVDPGGSSDLEQTLSAETTTREKLIIIPLYLKHYLECVLWCHNDNFPFRKETNQEKQKMNYLRAFLLISYNVLFTRGRLFVNPRQLSKRTLQVKFLFLIPV